MNAKKAMQQRLPYKMGNSGDLLKHGVLAEYVRWRHQSDSPVRFIDLFGGEPDEEMTDEFKERVLGLPEESALRCAQTKAQHGVYLGSGLVARNAGARQVLTNDCDPDRRERLKNAGLDLLPKEFPNCDPEELGWDAYRLLDDVVRELRTDDLVLVDPFHEFLKDHAEEVIPRLACAVTEKQAAVLLFALNLNPDNEVGRRFDDLLAEHLPGAWRITCPPHPDLRKYYAEVVLVSPLTMGPPCATAWLLRKRLERFAEKLQHVLFPLAVRTVGAPGRQVSSLQRNDRVQVLHRLFDLFEGNDAAAEVRRLKLEDEES